MTTQPTWKANILLGMALLWACLILYLSLANIGDIKLMTFDASDKLYHTGCYFILGLLWLLFFYVKQGSMGNTKKLIISGCLVFFGIIIEILQIVLTTYRTFDLWDALANAVGILLANLFFNLLIERINKK